MKTNTPKWIRVLKRNTKARYRYWLKKANGDHQLAKQLQWEKEQRFQDKLDELSFREEMDNT